MAKLTPAEELKAKRELLKLEKESAKINKKINEGVNVRQSTLDDEITRQREIVQLQEKIAGLSDEGLSLAKQAENLSKTKFKLSRKIELSGKSHSKQISDQLKLEGSHAKLMAENIKQRDAAGELGDDAQKLAEEHLGLLSEMGSGSLDLAVIQEKLNDLTKNKAVMDEVIDELGEGHLKNIQQSLSARLDMGRAEELSNKAMSGIDDLTGGMATKVKDAKDMMGKMGMKAGLAAAAIMAIVAILVDFSGKMDAIGGQFGAIGLQSTEFRDDLLASSAEAAKLGKDFEDVVESITTLTSEFGVGFKEARSMANEVISVSMGLGLSTSEGGQLIGVLSTITGLSNDTAVALAQQTTLLATASDVAPQQVLRDIAGSSEVVAKFTDASGKNILTGAIQARKLGTNLETAASAAESMLDFQSAIEQAMTASVMIGRQVNIQKLQELSLASDLKGVAKEQRRLLGDQSDFLAMNFLQREALAKAVGLSVDQAAKMLDKEEDAITLAGELAKQKGFEELIGPNTISELTEMMNNLKSTGAILVNVLGPPLNFVVGLISTMAVGLSTVVDFLAKYKVALLGVASVLGIFKAKAIGAAIAGAWKAAFTGPTALLGPLGIGLGIAAALTAVGAIMKSANTAVPMAEGGIVTGPTNALIGEAGSEAVIPISKLADFMADAMAPVVSSIDKLNEDFTKKHVPALALSNESGGKKAGREIGRQFQMNAA